MGAEKNRAARQAGLKIRNKSKNDPKVGRKCLISIPSRIGSCQRSVTIAQTAKKKIVKIRMAIPAYPNDAYRRQRAGSFSRIRNSALNNTPQLKASRKFGKRHSRKPASAGSASGDSVSSR